MYKYQYPVQCLTEDLHCLWSKDYNDTNFYLSTEAVIKSARLQKDGRPFSHWVWYNGWN